MSPIIKKLAFRNKEISYTIHGNANTPVFLLHGFTEDAQVWRNQVDNFTDQLLVVPSLPGVQDSEYNDELLSLEHIAAGIKAIADNEGYKEIILVGHSMGGYISLAFAKNYSRYVKALCLFHSSALADSEEKKSHRQKSIEFLESNDSAVFVRTSVPALFYKPETKVEIINEQVTAAEKIPAATLRQQLRMMKERTDSKIVIQNLFVPLLWILGEHDTAVPLESGLQQVTLCQKTEIQILRNTGHMGMLEEPVKANEILQNFFIAVEAGA